MKHFTRLTVFFALPLLFIFGFSTISMATCSGEIVKIKLRNLAGDRSIKLVDGKTYTSADLPERSRIRVFVSGQHESAIFRVTGDMFEEHTDNKAPYTFQGSDGIRFTPGTYAIRVRLYAQNDGQGEMCHVKVINFTVVDGPSTAEIKRVKLHNLDGDNSFKIQDGKSYSLGELPTRFKMSVGASGYHESVRILISGPITGNHVDNKGPYTYQGDNGLDFTPGDYTVIVQLFNENNTGGQMADEKRINFSILPGPSSAEIRRIKLQAVGGGNNINLCDGAVYTLDQLPELCRIKGNVKGFHESLKFEISGPITGQHIDNKLPYFCSGEQGLEFVPGEYTINTKLYSSNHAGGVMFDEKSVSFSVVATEEEACTAEITDLIINALDGSGDITIENGRTYDINELPGSFNIEALTAGDVESVRFAISGGLNNQHTENWPPYRYKGDNNPMNIAQGTYTVTARAHTENHANGIVCDEKTITFSIGGQLACNGEVEKLMFHALDGGEDVEIANGKVYYLDQLPSQFNIEAIPNGDIESVRFSIGGSMNDHHTENWPPYRYKGDNSPTNIQPGQYNIQAKAYMENYANGQLCDEMQLSFIIEAESPTVSGGSIAPANCDNGTLTLGNEDSPEANDGNIEVVWIKAGAGNCENAAEELEEVNIGELYDNFITAGGFGSLNPGIGNTSWEFLPDDGDNDPMELRIEGVQGSNCYMRLARIEGTQEFTGHTESLKITASDCPNCNDPIDGGLITGDDQDPSSGFVVIENDRAPANPGNGIDTPETIFIKSDQDTSDAFNELATVNVSQAYEEFQAAGGFGVASAQIGNTSWEFVDDGDDDPLTLYDDEILAQACYIRCARAVGCSEFHGDSNPVTISIGGSGGALVVNDDGNEASDTRMTTDDSDDGSGEEETIEERTEEIVVEEIPEAFRQVDESLTVFPNPAHSVVFFATDKFSNKGGMLRIYNGVGQLLFEQRFNAGRSTTYEFDLENYALGLYFIQLEFEDGEKLVNRFVVD
jgi:hypothetical protein